MFQRTLRWNAVGVVFASLLVLSLVAPTQARAREPLNGWQVTALLRSWWSGLWADRCPFPARTSSADPSRTQDKRTSSADPNGLNLESPVLLQAVPAEPAGAH